MALSMLGVALMLAPLLFRSVRDGTLDGSPTSIVAAVCLGAGALLTLLGRMRWVQHTRRERDALHSSHRAPPRS